jgi:hypothetical protein
VEPTATRLLGQGLQRIATTHHPFEQAAKLPNRLNPAVVLQMQPFQYRREAGRNRPSTRRANLTPRPVHQRKIGVESDGQIAANIDCEDRCELLEPFANPVFAMFVVVTGDGIGAAEKCPTDTPSDAVIESNLKLTVFAQIDGCSGSLP